MAELKLKDEIEEIKLKDEKLEEIKKSKPKQAWAEISNEILNEAPIEEEEDIEDVDPLENLEIKQLADKDIKEILEKRISEHKEKKAELEELIHKKSFAYYVPLIKLEQALDVFLLRLSELNKAVPVDQKQIIDLINMFYLKNKLYMSIINSFIISSKKENIIPHMFVENELSFISLYKKCNLCCRFIRALNLQELNAKRISKSCYDIINHITLCSKFSFVELLKDEITEKVNNLPLDAIEACLDLDNQNSEIIVIRSYFLTLHNVFDLIPIVGDTYDQTLCFNELYVRLFKHIDKKLQLSDDASAKLIQINLIMQLCLLLVGLSNNKIFDNNKNLQLKEISELSKIIKELINCKDFKADENKKRELVKFLCNTTELMFRLKYGKNIPQDYTFLIEGSLPASRPIEWKPMRQFPKKFKESCNHEKLQVVIRNIGGIDTYNIYEADEFAKYALALNRSDSEQIMRSVIYCGSCFKQLNFAFPMVTLVSSSIFKLLIDTYTHEDHDKILKLLKESNKDELSKLKARSDDRLVVKVPNNIDKWSLINVSQYYDNKKQRHFVITDNEGNIFNVRTKNSKFKLLLNSLNLSNDADMEQVLDKLLVADKIKEQDMTYVFLCIGGNLEPSISFLFSKTKEGLIFEKDEVINVKQIEKQQLADLKENESYIGFINRPEASMTKCLYFAIRPSKIHIKKTKYHNELVLNNVISPEIYQANKIKKHEVKTEILTVEDLTAL